MQRYKDTINIKAILDKIIQESHWESGINQAKIQQIWQEIAGTAILRYTQEIKLQNNTLTIRLQSAPLRQELDYKKSKLIELFNQNIGKDLIKEIILV